MQVSRSESIFNEHVYIPKYDGRGLCSGGFRRGLMTTDDAHFIAIA